MIASITIRWFVQFLTNDMKSMNELNTLEEFMRKILLNEKESFRENT